jgi:tetratricopeptide (TPR) repeat protein
VKRLLTLVSALVMMAGVLWGFARFLRAPEPRVSTHERLESALRTLQSGDLEGFHRIRDSFREGINSREFEHYFDGLLALREGHWDRADREFSRLNLSGDLRPFALISRAELLYRMGRLSEAEFLLRQLVSDLPDHLDAHRLLGAIYFDLGSYDLAVAHLEKVVKQDAQSVGSNRLLGLMYHEFERHAKASQYFQAALALQPPEGMRHDLIAELAESLIAQQEFEAALQLIEGVELIERDENLRFVALRTRCLWNLNRQHEARELIESIPGAAARDRQFCLIALRISMDDRNWASAVEMATSYLEHDPFDSEIRYQLAQAYARLGRQDDYEREIALYQQSTEDAQRLTELNLKAVKDPRDAAVRDELAELCDSLGKKNLAEMWRIAARNCREGLVLFSESETSRGEPSAP